MHMASQPYAVLVYSENFLSNNGNGYFPEILKICKLLQIYRLFQRILWARLIVFSSQISTEPLHFFPCPETRLLFLFLIYKAKLACSSLTYADWSLLKAGVHFNIRGHRDPLPTHKRILGMFSCGISARFYS